MDESWSVNNGMQPNSVGIATPPQQQFSSGTGDIILAPSAKKSKKGLIIGLLFGFLVLAAGVCAVLYFLLPKENEEAAISAMRENLGSVEIMDQIFVDSYYSEMSVAEIFTEAEYEKINNAMTGFSNLQKKLSGIEASKIEESRRADYEIVRARLDSRVGYFQSSVDLYNTIYNAYINNNAGELEKLIGSDNDNTALAAERFYNYITEQNEYQTIIDENGCPFAVGVETSEICIETVKDWRENISALQSNTVIVSTIFDTNQIIDNEDILGVDSDEEIEDILIAPYIKKIIGEEK